MIEYGLLASKSLEMFSDISFQLKDLLYSNPYVVIAIVIFAIIFYFLVWK
ncbi:MAG: ABC-type multidrug transport system permease subunit [Desulforhopalus sp.]|jgi:ABC-type multidrug transport system permease subunit